MLFCNQDDACFSCFSVVLNFDCIPIVCCYNSAELWALALTTDVINLHLQHNIIPALKLCNKFSCVWNSELLVRSSLDTNIFIPHGTNLRDVSHVMSFYYKLHVPDATLAVGKQCVVTLSRNQMQNQHRAHTHARVPPALSEKKTDLTKQFDQHPLVSLNLLLCPWLQHDNERAELFAQRGQENPRVPEVGRQLQQHLLSSRWEGDAYVWGEAVEDGVKLQPNDLHRRLAQTMSSPETLQQS